MQQKTTRRFSVGSKWASPSRTHVDRRPSPHLLPPSLGSWCLPLLLLLFLLLLRAAQDAHCARQTLQHSLKYLLILLLLLLINRSHQSHRFLLHLWFLIVPLLPPLLRSGLSLAPLSIEHHMLLLWSSEQQHQQQTPSPTPTSCHQPGQQHGRRLRRFSHRSRHRFRMLHR